MAGQPSKSTAADREQRFKDTVRRIKAAQKRQAEADTYPLPPERTAFGTLRLWQKANHDYNLERTKVLGEPFQPCDRCIGKHPCIIDISATSIGSRRKHKCYQCYKAGAPCSNEEIAEQRNVQHRRLLDMGSATGSQAEAWQEKVRQRDSEIRLSIEKKKRAEDRRIEQAQEREVEMLRAQTATAQATTQQAIRDTERFRALTSVANASCSGMIEPLTEESLVKIFGEQASANHPRMMKEAIILRTSPRTIVSNQSIVHQSQAMTRATATSCSVMEVDEESGFDQVGVSLQVMELEDEQNESNDIEAALWASNFSRSVKYYESFAKSIFR